MKKLMIATIMFMGFTGVTFAQTKKPATAAKPVAHSEVKKATPAAIKPVSTTAVAAKPETNTAAAATTKKHVHEKKNGTAGKRHKKSMATAATVKKDGSPDKRFKENKKS